jgi:poly(hydroxyalkanoate) depolymerase family esterase
MKMDFAGAMRAATTLTRNKNLMDATRVIQNALLLGQGAATSDDRAEAMRAIGPLTIEITPDAATPPTPALPDWTGDLAAALGRAKLPGFGLEGLARGKPRKPLEIPEGAQYLSRSYACAAGRRTYTVYVPRAEATGRRALLVMLHGGTQDADDFAAGTRMNALAEEHGCVVVYPNQSKSANASLCWNWFRPEDQERDRGEPSIIAGITSEVIAEYDIDPQRVFVAGLSAGGAMASVMAATYPELYVGAGVHSGLAYRSATDVVSAFAAMRGDPGLPGLRHKAPSAPAHAPRVPTIVFHGDADHIVHPSNAARVREAQARSDDRVERARSGRAASRPFTLEIVHDRSGAAVGEHWLIHGSGHAWSGGSPDGTYTDPQGPDASREMLRFFLEQSRKADLTPR